MPIYEFACECGEVVCVMRDIVHRDEPLECRACALLMQRQLAAPMGRVRGGTPKSNDTYNYADRFTADITGKHMEEVASSGLHTPLPKRR
jgi:putative FmdB family regulatory protein